MRSLRLQNLPRIRGRSDRSCSGYSGNSEEGRAVGCDFNGLTRSRHSRGESRTEGGHLTFLDHCIRHCKGCGDEPRHQRGEYHLSACSVRCGLEILIGSRAYGQRRFQVAFRRIFSISSDSPPLKWAHRSEQFARSPERKSWASAPSADQQ